MSTKTGRVTASSSHTERKGPSHEDRVLPLNHDASSQNEATATTSSAISASPAEQPDAPSGAAERIVVQIAINGFRAAKDYLFKNWRPIAISLVGATGIGATVLPMNGVHEMEGRVPAIKPMRECKAPLKTTPTVEEIDKFLANPENYDLQKDIWEYSVNSHGEFAGTRWLQTRGNAPMKVTGYLAKGDWVDGAIRGEKGHGVYHLEARNNEEIYRGTFTALDCSLPQDMMIVCPYALFPKDVPEREVGMAGMVCRRYVSSADSKIATNP
jgi:hypothetical protein